MVTENNYTIQNMFVLAELYKLYVLSGVCELWMVVYWGVILTQFIALFAAKSSVVYGWEDNAYNSCEVIVKKEETFSS